MQSSHCRVTATARAINYRVFASSSPVFAPRFAQCAVAAHRFRADSAEVDDSLQEPLLIVVPFKHHVLFPFFEWLFHFAAQRDRRKCAAILGRRSRVKTPFEVHPARATGALAGLEIGEVPHVHPRHERSLRLRHPDTGAGYSTWYSSVHISGGVLCAPGRVSVPNSAMMIGLPKACAARPVRAPAPARLHRAARPATYQP